MRAQHPGKGAQIGNRTREPNTVVLIDHPFSGLAQRLAGLPHRLGQVGQYRAGLFGGGLDLIKEPPRGFAPVDHFARHKVHRLNAVGALVNRGHAHITGILRRPGFLDHTHPAMDLDAHMRDLVANIRAKGLGHRRQQRRAAFPRLISRRCGHVDGHRAHQGNAPRRINVGTHGHQHPAHVGVIDDGPGGTFGLALLAVQRIVKRVLIGTLSRPDALTTDPQPGVVHHGEHRRHAATFGPHHPTARAVILHHAGGRAVQAHLVLQAHNFERVCHARIAVLIRDIAGHKEQADAFGARRCAWNAGQNQMAHIVGKVVIAPGNIDLLTCYGIGPVAIVLRLGGQGTHIRSGLRLGQVHGARPFARNQLGQVQVLDGVACMVFQCLNLALAHQRGQLQ
mmetsp:Transcript_29398/g.57411  ORF Transcript_29398/g.57411 Transcript_29398/m.57411 type:complete len:395 (-) Transcript_29398:423-1607(-)